MGFHKFNIRSESKDEIRSYSEGRSEEEILLDIEAEIESDTYYEIKYHLCNHDIPKPCVDEEVLVSKGVIPEKVI